jgi:O-antigen biosynthesis protein
MLVSFIIPLYNCLALTRAMLESLIKTLPSSLACEILLVDDGSTDGTREWLQSLVSPDGPLQKTAGANNTESSIPHYRVILNPKNLGFAATCNRGAALAQGEFIFFLNNDLVLLPRWLEPMLGAFMRFRDAGLVGNVQCNALTGAVDHSGIIFNHKGKPEHNTARPISARITGYRRVAALTGACFATRTTVWRQLGGFDEGFVNGAEDVDLCLRAEASGFQHYIALHSVVLHHVSQSPGRKLRDEQNTYRLVLRWQDKIVQKINRAWCWHHLESYWSEPRDFPDQQLARQAFYYVLYLRKRPPDGACLGARLAVELELQRWATLAVPRD